MRKVNLKVLADQEAFEYLNNTDDDLKPFWEEADELFQVRSNILDYDEDWFYIKQASDFYKDYLEGHTWEEIQASEELRNAYSFWSDLYKDAWGCRPRVFV